MSESSDGVSALNLLFQALEPAVAGQTTLAEALAHSFPTVLETLGYADGRLVLLDRNGGVILFQTIANGRLYEPDRSAMHEILARSIEGRVLQQACMQQASGPRESLDGIAVPQAAAGLKAWSAICTPIFFAEAAAGTLTVLKPGRDQFSNVDETLLHLLAGQIGMSFAAVDYRNRLLTSDQRYQDLLQDKQDLAAVLVHDLQGPAGNIVTSLEMIQDEVGYDGESSLADLADIAARSGRHLQAMIESLLDVSRLEAGQVVEGREAMLVAGAIDHVLDITALDFEERRVTPIIEIEADLPPMLANPSILQRILFNLLDNALKQSKQNQTITIQARLDSGKSAVLFCIADQGPGVPQEFRQRIFEKFQRVDQGSSSKGLGLGLAFCRLAVEAHGGQIWVEENPGGGARFCLTIPVAESKRRATEP